MTSRYLYIVARTQPALYAELSGRFADDPHVTVILDRRHDEGVALSAAERAIRQPRDPRRNAEVQNGLRERSYAVVTIPA